VVLKYDVLYDEQETEADDGGSGRQRIQKIWRIILNDLAIEDGDPGHGALAPLAARSRRMLAWYVNNEEVFIDAPPGYGVSPFLKVWKLLEIIFENFGYRVSENPFFTHGQLRRLVVLNNVMDTVLSGTLHYRDLMPDVTVDALLQSLYHKFGLLWYVDSNARTVRLRFIREVLNTDRSGAVDLTPCQIREPEITFAAPKQLKLTASRGLASVFYTSETLYRTFEEFLQAYDGEFTDRSSNTPAQVDKYFDPSKSQYVILESIRIAAKIPQHNYSSVFFAWEKKTPGLAYETIEMEDLCMPFDLIYTEQVVALFYGAGMKHYYSDVTVEGETPAEEENAAQVAFAFGWGVTDFTSYASWNWFFASQINRDVHGNFLYDPEGNRYDLSLAINREDGLYNRFWKAYDAFLRHSNQEVRCSLKLSDAALISLRMDTVMMLHFQPLAAAQIPFKLNAPANVSECTFRTLRLYRPYDLAAEQHIPVYSNQRYYWHVISEVKIPPIGSPYTEYGFGYGFYVTADGTAHDTRMLFLSPPTEAQFLNQEPLLFVYHTVAKASGMPDIQVTTTVTYIPAEIPYP
jgi:hypothetical protein